MIPGLAELVPSEAVGSFRLPDGSERPLVAPREAQGFADVLAWAAREGRAVLVIGGGSRLRALNRHERVDLVLSTRNYTGIVAYEPGDGTLTARAGSTWAELAAAVARGGHHLAPDVPHPTHTTLGGVLGSGERGFDRLRHGPARHQVLGTRVALADGSLSKSGGALVKNVTGYDLHRLYAGSWGTLGVILEASLRLYPRPDAEAAVLATFDDRARALEAARAIHELPVRPIAVVLHGAQGSGLELAVFLAQRSDVLAWELQEIAARLPAPRTVEGEAAAALRIRMRDRPDRPGPALVLSLRPSQVASTWAELERKASELGLPLEIACHPLVATLEVDLPGADELPAERLLAFHRALLAAGAPLHWERAPRGLREAREPIDVFGAPPSALPWMRRMKQALDPTSVFARGGFLGGT